VTRDSTFSRANPNDAHIYKNGKNVQKRGMGDFALPFFPPEAPKSTMMTCSFGAFMHMGFEAPLTSPT
jgi:hypothetical protein